MTSKIQRLMRQTAERMLVDSIRHAREENPRLIKAKSLHTQKLFAKMNKQSNKRLQDYWRKQIKRYGGKC